MPILEISNIYLTKASLEEVENSIANEEAKSCRCQIELNQLKQKAEKSISEKDEDIDSARRNAVKSVEQIQVR